MQCIHSSFPGAASGSIYTKVVVNCLGSIHGKPDQNLIVSEERGPFLINAIAVCLDRVVTVNTRYSKFALQFDKFFEEVKTGLKIKKKPQIDSAENGE
jgi:hypothetical protein